MLPKIVIVGRPNVGKSSLFNLLAGRKVSIVDPTAGVTRDRIGTQIEIPPEFVGDEPTHAELVDTGGYGIEDTMDLTADVERQIAEGLAEADVVLFVVDAQSGIVPLDETVARLLRQSGAKSKPVVLVSNKVDADNLEPAGYDAMELGFGEPVMVSAKTKHNLRVFHDTLRAALEKVPPITDDPDAPSAGLKIALVGKRNAGKSTLLNALAGRDRVIVSEKPGTTRDSIDVRIEWDSPKGKVAFTAIDTAGLRRTKSLEGDIEYYSQHRSLRSVRRADVCLFLIDAEVRISQVDHLLMQEVLKHHKPTVIVVNKWDTVDKKATEEQYAQYLEQELKGLTFAPIVFISAKKAEGLQEAVAIAYNLHQQSSHRLGTGELNRFFEQALLTRAPRTSKGGKQPRLYYATQVATNPPTLALFVNDPDLFDHHYQRYLFNRMREELPFSEVPIKLLLRGKQKMTLGERLTSHDEE